MYINPQDLNRDEELAARGLPEIAYVDNTWDKSDGAPPVIAIRRGESGFHPIHTTLSAAALNQASGVTWAQAEAMHTGSMFGWTVPGAHPRAHGARMPKANVGDL